MHNPIHSVLVINSSSRTEGSVSRQLTKRLADRVATENPAAVFTDRDLINSLPSVTQDWIGANFTPSDDRSADQADVLGLSDTLIAEVKAADLLLIGLPIYNFGVPAALKAWIDLICRVGETFVYTETGPKGLLSGRRAIVTVASGGVPVGSPMDHATTYLTQVLAFIGITDVTYISATGLAMNPDAAIETANAQIDTLELAAAA